VGSSEITTRIGATIRSLVIDEIYLTVLIPGDLPEPEAEAIRQALNAKHFLAHLRRAIRDVLRRYSALGKARVMVSR
jgi:hypothetical protein